MPATNQELFKQIKKSTKKKDFESALKTLNTLINSKPKLELKNLSQWTQLFCWVLSEISTEKILDDNNNQTDDNCDLDNADDLLKTLLEDYRLELTDSDYFELSIAFLARGKITESAAFLGFAFKISKPTIFSTSYAWAIQCPVANKWSRAISKCCV